MTIRKPFRWIEKHYHITRASLWERIQKIPNFKKDHMLKFKNMWLIDDSGIKEITFAKTNSTSKFKNTKKKTNYNFTKQYLIKQNQMLIKNNNQLIRSNNHLSKTVSNLSQVNTLLKSINATNKRLLANQSKQKELPKVKQHGWIWRLFH